MKKEVKLYNMIFPLWAFYILPWGWVVILPANFIIDSIVFVAALAVFKIPEKKATYKRCILRIWAYGFLADVIGTGFLLLVFSFGYFGNDIIYNPLSSPVAFAVFSCGVILAGACIYLFNYKKILPALGLNDKINKKIAFIMAVITMPYTMYIPTTFW